MISRIGFLDRTRSSIENRGKNRLFQGFQKCFFRLVFDALGQILELSFHLSSELAPSYFESDCVGKKNTVKRLKFLGEILFFFSVEI